MSKQSAYDQLRHQLDSDILAASNLKTEPERKGFVNRTFTSLHKARQENRVTQSDYVKLLNRRAGKMLLLQWAEKTIEYDTYDVVQLLNFLLAHEQEIRNQAKETSDVLIPEAHKRTEAAMRADAGIVDYSQDE